VERLEFRRLAELTRSIGATLDLHVALERACEALALVRDDVCWTVHAAAGDGYHLVARAGARVAAPPPISRHGLTAAVAARATALLVPDLRLDPRGCEEATWLMEAGIDSYFGVPILDGTAVVGVLAGACAATAALTPEERGLVEFFAAQAGIAARNAGLFAESENRRAAAEALAELGQTLVESLDLATVGRRIADAVCTLLRAPASALYDLDPVTGDYRQIAISGGAGQTWTSVLPAGTGLIGLAVVSGTTVAVPDVLADARIRYTPDLRARVEFNPNQPVLAVPLVVKQAPVGALAVADRRGRRFDADELRLARVFANQAAVALDNARLYDEAERRRQEAEHAQGEAETANRLKDDFLATLSHELRTPLTTMLAWVRLLLRRSLDPAATARGLQAIERNVKLQARLIDDLLDISRIGSGKLAIQLQILDLAELVRSSIDALRPDAESKEIRLDVGREPLVPRVLGDPERLQQVVRNLVENAVKFTPPGGRVAVRVESCDADAVITVTDTGQGIRPDHLANVFDRFRQGDSTITRRHGGLGLGLAIVRDLVELHGGTVTAESAGSGRESCFVVRLPAATGAATGARTGSPPAAQDADSSPLLAGVRILLVEDEPDSRAVLHTVLQESRAESRVAASAPEALKILEAFAPAVLVCDIGLPGEDGYQLMRALRAQGVGVPAIALTAYAGSEDRRRALAAGYQRHVPKPVDPDDLVRAIRDVIDADRASRR
jgi:signal transduction histidine kinase